MLLGIVITHQSGRTTRSLEKMEWGRVFSETVTTGSYLLEASAIATVVPEQERYYALGEM